MSTDFEQIMYLLDTMKTQLMVTFSTLTMHTQTGVRYE